jgi:nucleoside-diphosphate-sugar epimerase
MASRIPDDFPRKIVLGATGHLGAILRAFWPNDASIVWQSRQKTHGFSFIDPLSDPQTWPAKTFNPQAVFCLSGITPARAAQTGARMGDNIDLALAAIRASATLGAHRVFLASSAAVYGAEDGEMDETAICNPASEYGRAKLEMEQRSIDLGQNLNIPVTCLRIGNVAGADAIVGGWKVGMALDQLPDGTTPARSYIGPKTFADVLATLANTPNLPPILNVAAPGTVHMGDLLDAAGLEWQPRKAGPGVIANVTLSTRRLALHFNFAPQASTAEGQIAEWLDYKRRVQ